MKKLHWGIVRKRLLIILQAYQVEAILGLFFFTLFIINEPLSYPENRPLRWVQAFFPVLFVVSYCCNHYFRGKVRFLYYLSLGLLVPLLLLRGQLEGFIDSMAFFFTLLLTAFLLLGHRRTADSVSFVRHCIRLLVNLAQACLTGLLLLGMVAAIYWSLDYIYDWDYSGKFLEYVSFFTLYLFTPLFFCSLQKEEDDADWEILPKGLQFILNFILSPGIIAYTAVLYVYSITIAFRWELPKGGVAYMVMGFIMAAFFGHMSQQLLSRRYYDWFYRYFSFFAVPPLLLFWVGLAHRLSAYSFTESRVYLLAAGVLMTLYTCFLLSKRLSNYRLMLLISAGAIILLTYIPGISAKSLGIYAQTNRMKDLARELALWDTAANRLTGTKDFQTEDSLKLLQARELDESYEYLRKQIGRERMITRYGKNELSLKDMDNGDRYEYFSFPSDTVSIKGYRTCVLNCKLSTSEDILSVTQKGELLLQVNIKAHFDRYKDKMDLWENGSPTSIEPFCLENDSCLVILSGIKKDNRSYGAREYGEVQVFLK